MTKRPILVVDDEPALLQLTRRYLERLGYEVEAFPDAASAWQRFRVDPPHWSLVIADLSLPDKPGDQLISEMITLQPALRAIVWSGYAFDASSLGTQPGQVRSLQKPFSPKIFCETVSNLTS